MLNRLRTAALTASGRLRKVVMITRKTTLGEVRQGCGHRLLGRLGQARRDQASRLLAALSDLDDLLFTGMAASPGGDDGRQEPRCARL